MPSIMTTGRSSWCSERDSHCSNCSSLKATKRHDVALLDTDSACSGGGKKQPTVSVLMRWPKLWTSR